MASIVKRCNKYFVVYRYTDDKGYKKQKWECFNTKAEANKRKKEVEFQESSGILLVPKTIVLSELLDEFVSVYGVNKWALSTYQNKIRLIENYINPTLGNVKIEKITTRVIDNFYLYLSTTKSVTNNGHSKTEYVTPYMIHEIHKLLNCAFNQAIKWEMMGKNPCKGAILPEKKTEERKIWDADTLFKAIDLCEDDILKLALNVAFAGSLRMGEMLGLTWDCLDISDEAIKQGNTYIYVEKELQRVKLNVMQKLNDKDVLFKFPQSSNEVKTILVLKSPKTESSVRKVFIPETVAKMLQQRKAELDNYKKLFGNEFTDYNLVFCQPNGSPLEKNCITRAMEQLIKKNNLPPVVFHSIRHSSITYKLKLTGGDIKAVQGDSGHSQSKIITDIYSHIIDEDRKRNATILENTFYNKNKEAVEQSTEDNRRTDEQMLLHLLSNPEMAKLIKEIANVI